MAGTSGITILLADDETHITHVVSARLSKLGFTVMVAQDGEEALELANRTRPDLVVTDLQMPHMSGLELAKALKASKTTSDVPVIMLTARGYIADAAEIAQTNIRKMMSKPFSVREVAENVAKLLDVELGDQREAA